MPAEFEPTTDQRALVQNAAAFTRRRYASIFATWLTWPSFVLGLIESSAYGWYVALIFCPLFNFFAARFK
jgi:hypothetical protein